MQAAESRNQDLAIRARLAASVSVGLFAAQVQIHAGAGCSVPGVLAPLNPRIHRGAWAPGHLGGVARFSMRGSTRRATILRLIDFFHDLIDVGLTPTP